MNGSGETGWEGRRPTTFPCTASAPGPLPQAQQAHEKSPLGSHPARASPGPPVSPSVSAPTALSNRTVSSAVSGLPLGQTRVLVQKCALQLCTGVSRGHATRRWAWSCHGRGGAESRALRCQGPGRRHLANLEARAQTGE